MNRLRIRIGGRVRQYSISPGGTMLMDYVEGLIQVKLHLEFGVYGYTLEYLGEFAWDIFMDGSKIGHVKAWYEKTVIHDSGHPSLWNWFLLVGSVYWALC